MCHLQINRPRLIASDLIRRSGDPALWRLGFRRSSNSDNDPELDSLLHLNEESRETDEDKELKRSGEQSPDAQKILEPTEDDRQQTTTQPSSLLRPETAAALASLASSHQKSSETTKRDDANELERKLKAKRARESRRSTQGVTKEIGRAHV